MMFNYTIVSTVLTDVLGISITGILVVMFGLALLSLAVSLFKHFIPGAQKAPTPIIAEDDEEPEMPIEKAHNLDEDQITAILTAVTIEWKLYHEEANSEYSFDYQGQSLSSWTISEYIAE